jgi:hypothetical protein
MGFGGEKAAESLFAILERSHAASQAMDNFCIVGFYIGRGKLEMKLIINTAHTPSLVFSPSRFASPTNGMFNLHGDQHEVYEHDSTSIYERNSISISWPYLNRTCGLPDEN